MKKLGRACNPKALLAIGAISVNAAESAEHCAYEPEGLDVSGLGKKEAEFALRDKQYLLENSVQRHLDSVAKNKGYDSILSASTYAGYTNQFQAEGQAFGKWRSDVWTYCNTALAKVRSGARAIPTEAELIAELPPLVLP